VDAEAEVDVEGEDLDDLFGCDRCGGRCRG